MTNFYKMNPEVKALWVADLKANPLRQGRGCLRKGDAFCCLGRLTELYRQSKANTKQLDWGQRGPSGDYNFQGEGGILPKVVAEWADFKDLYGTNIVPTPFNEHMVQRNYVLANGEVHLPHLNDSGYSFEAIADIIEKHF